MDLQQTYLSAQFLTFACKIKRDLRLSIDPKMFSIWPEARFSMSSFYKPSRLQPYDIEAVFNSFYPDAHSVLFPSARAGLSAILSVHFSRNDHVWIPPYASYCVISSIGLVATPTPKMSPEIEATLIFHQWGYAHKPKIRGLVIEDSVDTLIASKGCVFPNDGRYELLSLPKIFGCLFGGVVLCQNAADADVLRRVRDQRTILKWGHIFNRLMAKYSKASLLNWHNSEAENGFLPATVCDDVMGKITALDTLVVDRKNKLDLIKGANLKTFGKISDTRLPTCVAIDSEILNKNSVDLTAYCRHFSPGQDFTSLKKVLPLAVHKDILCHELEQSLEIFYC